MLTGAHAPIYWRYDLDQDTNPHLMERLGVNVAFNPGAIEWNGKILLVARVEGLDRKSFTPEDHLRSRASVEQRIALIAKNLKLMDKEEYGFLR